MEESLYAYEAPEIDPASLGERPDRFGLPVAVAVELELARVAPVLDPRARREHARHAEVPRERTDDLLGRGAHDVDVPSLGPVQLHQVERLLVHERVDDVDQDVLDEAFDLVPVPPSRELEHPLLEPVHLLLVRADQRVDELRVRAAHELPARDHPRPVHRPGQGERGRARDDRLVEVEERRFHRPHGIGDRWRDWTAEGPGDRSPGPSVVGANLLEGGAPRAHLVGRQVPRPCAEHVGARRVVLHDPNGERTARARASCGCPGTRGRRRGGS